MQVYLHIYKTADVSDLMRKTKTQSGKEETHRELQTERRVRERHRTNVRDRKSIYRLERDVKKQGETGGVRGRECRKDGDVWGWEE